MEFNDDDFGRQKITSNLSDTECKMTFRVIREDNRWYSAIERWKKTDDPKSASWEEIQDAEPQYFVEWMKSLNRLIISSTLTC